MKIYCGVEVEVHLFLVLALGVGEWLVVRQGSFIPEVRSSGTQQIGGWTAEPVRSRCFGEEENLLHLPGINPQYVHVLVYAQHSFAHLYAG